MSTKSVSGISIRPVAKDRLAVDLDTSTGISYNGTTHTQPTTGATNASNYQRFYMAKGEELTRERKVSMIENEELILKLLPPEDHQKAREQIEEYRNEVGIE